MISSTLLARAIKENLHVVDNPSAFADTIINYLQDRHLVHLLPNVLRKLEDLKQKEAKASTITISTSHEFSKDLIEKIKRYEGAPKGDAYDISVDESLVGGFVIKGNNRILDASVKRNIQFLRASLTK